MTNQYFSSFLAECQSAKPFQKRDQIIIGINQRDLRSKKLKFPKIPPEFEALRERKEVLVNKKRLFVSPLELQIAFKLYLGSEKDIEDAKHLYRLFKGKLDRRLLDDHNQKLNITHVFRRYLE